jgi:hypothetical protein
MKKLVLIILMMFIIFIGYELYIDEHTFVVTCYQVSTMEDDLFRKKDYSNIRFT